MRDARNIILLNIQHRAILYQHITIMNIQDSSFIITQFGTGKCVIRDSAIKHFTKLTLFPRIMEIEVMQRPSDLIRELTVFTFFCYI